MSVDFHLKLLATVFAVFILATAPAVSAQKLAPSPEADAKLQEGYRALVGKDLNAAEAAFRESSRLAPNAAAPILGLAEVAKLRDDVKGAERWLKAALKAAPTSADARVAWGRYLYATRKFTEAEAALKAARKLDPKLLAVYLDLGELYLSGLFKPKEAERAFREAIRLRSNHAGAHNGLAGALQAQQRPAEAAVEFETAARLAPDNPLPLHALGRLHQNSGDADKALAAYGRALKVNPDFIPALLDRGDLYAAKNQPDRALADYSEAVRRAPKQAMAHFRLGMFHQGQHRSAEAVVAYRAAIAADPRFAPAYNNLAWLAAEGKSNLVEALGWAKRAVELQPGVPDFVDTLGQVYRARGELDLAIEQFRRAANAKPPRAEFHYRLGIALAEKGQRQEAIAALNEALKINKDFSGAADARSRLKQLGD